MMGPYHLTHQQYNDKPVYEKGDGDQVLFYSDQGHWMVGNETTGHSGVIKSTEPGLVFPPETGWEHDTDADGNWVNDPQLKLKSGID